MRSSAHHNSFAILVWAAIICGLMFALRSAQADTPADAVRESVATMHRWLDTDPRNGPGWRRFLKSKQLESELAKGDAADAEQVAKILAKYSGNTPGLHNEEFVAVRRSLEKWLAELQAHPEVDLTQALERAKDAYAPITDESVRQLKARVLEANKRLQRYLARQSAADAAQWKERVEWDILQTELQRKETPDLRELQRVINAFRQDEPGLERTEFTGLRDALVNYWNAVYFATIPGLDQQYAENIETLTKLVDSYAKKPSGEEGSEIGRTLGWLESGGQVPVLVRRVRRQHFRPNLFARVSGKLISAGLEEEIADTTGVRDNILGTSISGTATMTGNTLAKLIPSDQHAALDIRLTGAANSNSVGYKGPVTLYSTAYTSIDATKRITIDDEGLEGRPATAWCATSSSVNSLNAPPLIRRLAWRKVAKTKYQAEQIASRHAAGRVAWQVDQRANNLLAEANEAFNEKFRNPLVRRGQFPHTLQFTSTDDFLNLKLLQANVFQIGAPSDPPPVDGDDDLVVRVHESLVSNFSEAILGGQKMTSQSLAETLDKLGAKVPEDLNEEDWSITFEPIRPISAEFSGDQVTLMIRGRRFTRGDQVIPYAMFITATYKLEQSGNGGKLTRQGDVVADYTKPGAQSAKQIAFKTFLKKRFESMFKEKFETEGLKLPKRWEDAGPLQLKQIAAADGWLAANWQLPSAGEPVAAGLAESSKLAVNASGADE